MPHDAHFPPLVEGQKKREDEGGGGGRKEGEGEGEEGDEEGEDGGFVLVGGSHKHHHLESRVSPCHGRHLKGGRRSCRGSGGEVVSPGGR